jgi:hypothetical protein
MTSAHTGCWKCGVRRRKVIAAAGSVAAASLAGCLGVLGETTEKTEHLVTVANGTEESHTVNVLITNEEGDTLLDHTFPMDPNTGDEDVVFAGTPADVAVTIDEDVVKEFPWGPNESELYRSGGCSSESANTAALTIKVWGPDFDDPDDGPGFEDTDFMAIFGCEMPDASL